MTKKRVKINPLKLFKFGVKSLNAAGKNETDPTTTMITKTITGML